MILEIRESFCANNSLFCCSAATCSGGLFPGACHWAGKQTSGSRHSREPAVTHQGRATPPVPCTTYPCHPLLSGPLLFQGALLYAHLLQPASRHTEVPAFRRWVNQTQAVLWSLMEVHTVLRNTWWILMKAVLDMNSLCLKQRPTVLCWIRSCDSPPLIWQMGHSPFWLTTSASWTLMSSASKILPIIHQIQKEKIVFKT